MELSYNKYRSRRQELMFGLLGAVLALSGGGDRYGLFEPQEHGHSHRRRHNEGQRIAAKEARIKARRRRAQSR